MGVWKPVCRAALEREQQSGGGGTLELVEASRERKVLEKCGRTH